MEKQTSFRTLKNTYLAKDFDYMQKVWTARNLCILTNRVHSLEREIIIGDYNADNIAIFPSTSIFSLLTVMDKHNSNMMIASIGILLYSTSI